MIQGGPAALQISSANGTESSGAPVPAKELAQHLGDDPEFAGDCKAGQIFDHQVTTAGSSEDAAPPLHEVESADTARLARQVTRRVCSAAEVRLGLGSERKATHPELEAQPTLAGTTAAEQGSDMNKSTETKQSAGLTQQKLPELAMKARPETDAPQFVSFVPAPVGGLESPTPAGRLMQSAGETLPLAETFPAGVLLQVTELRKSGATELAVVMQPDADTQLVLRLSRNGDGAVVVHARCEQGSAELLAAHWGEIRHTLSQQGIQLGALEVAGDRPAETFPPHAGNGGPSPDGQPSSQRRGQPWPETLDDLPLLGSLNEPLGRRGVPRPPAGRTQLLESWA